MPTDEDRDELIEHPEVPEEPEAPPAPAPTFSLADVREIVREAVASVQPKPVAPARPGYVPAPEPEGATDEELATDPRGAMQKEINRALHPLREEMRQFTTFGLERLADLNLKTVGGDIPGYEDYKDEVKAKLATLEPVLRTNPETVRLVTADVVLSHLGEIKGKAREEGIRQGRGNAPMPSGVRPDPNAKKVPTPEELGLNVDMINEKGGPDQFARKVSDGRYTNWADYAAARQKMDAAPMKMGARGPARVMPFARLEPKKAGQPA